VCILLFGEALSETARDRLEIVFKSADGFEIAKRDLELRGPGEYLGERQSGEPLLRFADLERDHELLAQAIQAAGDMLSRHAKAARAHVERWIGRGKELMHT
jgi:ATP-dependent DNA helicase RecG